MLKILKTLILLLFSVQLLAQSDSLFVFPKGNSFTIMYTVHNGENVFALSRRFHVPPAILADANGLTYQSGIANGTLIVIPLGAYNQLKDKPANMGDARPLYYRVREEDNLYRISKYADISQHELQEWNDMPDNSVKAGQILFLGWVLFDATGLIPYKKPAVNAQPENISINKSKTINTTTLQKPNITNPVTKVVMQNKDGTTTIIMSPAAIDTLKHIDSLYLMSPFGKTYLQQTDSDGKVDSEKGAAVFFDTKTLNIKNMFYAFHNTTPRGTIIKVYFTNSQKFILAKVIGPVPDSKQYYNCIIAIGSNARDALGIKEDKTWCEIRYAKQKVINQKH